MLRVHVIECRRVRIGQCRYDKRNRSGSGVCVCIFSHHTGPGTYAAVGLRCANPFR